MSQVGLSGVGFERLSGVGVAPARPRSRDMPAQPCGALAGSGPPARGRTCSWVAQREGST
jgi:hypothetical protein